MLTTADLASYTKGRLDAEDAETQRLLDAGLATVRRYCGWHVTPVIEDDVLVLDGPGGDLLILPTLRLLEITTLVENDTLVEVDTLHASTRGLVRKVDRAWWTDRLAGISVVMTHGFEDAPDFDSAVLSFIDRSSLAGISGGGREVVGPFQFGGGTTEAGSVFSGSECAILDLYRLEPSP